MTKTHKTDSILSVKHVLRHFLVGSQRVQVRLGGVSIVAIHSLNRLLRVHVHPKPFSWRAGFTRVAHSRKASVFQSHSLSISKRPLHHTRTNTHSHTYTLHSDAHKYIQRHAHIQYIIHTKSHTEEDYILHTHFTKYHEKILCLPLHHTSGAVVARLAELFSFYKRMKTLLHFYSSRYVWQKSHLCCK